MSAGRLKVMLRRLIRLKVVWFCWHLLSSTSPVDDVYILLSEAGPYGWTVQIGSQGSLDDLKKIKSAGDSDKKMSSIKSSPLPSILKLHGGSKQW